MDKFIIILLLLMSAMPLSAQAHTTLTSSNPSEGEVLQMQPEQLELIFGTVIEEGSVMTLAGPDQSYEVENISINENVMTGSINTELPNGQYIIAWNIIGEDGHPIEGQLPFSVNAEAVSEEPADEQPATEEQPAIDEQTENPEAAESADSSQERGGLWSTVLIAAAAVLVGFGFYKLLKKKA
jgi:methionine-rich copper-binding protein CopC